MSIILVAARALIPLALALPLPIGQVGPSQAGDTDVVQGDADRYARMTVPVRIGDSGPPSRSSSGPPLQAAATMRI